MARKKPIIKPRERPSLGKYVTRKEARQATKLYCRLHPEENVRGVFIGRNKLLALLEQEDCQGIRIYLGSFRNSPAQTDFVVTGADSRGKNITDRDLIVARGMPCPPDCDDDGDM